MEPHSSSGDRRHEPSQRRVDVASAAEVRPCGRCGGEGLLSARVPHPIDRPDGHTVPGTQLVVLCQRCDIGDAAAGALITFFNVHSHVDLDNVHQCGNLIHAWVESIEIPPVDDAAVEAEWKSWCRGEL